ncbi:pleckstrin homology domain-containing family G member 3 isoform X2 [Rhinatrema bivittatum]|uniref:pleckstrin homology domain-containing family G member 3 isoform X2 n=1 Tax=Rhinatrema bivittatum TaxID=194408 RepID=UPI00112B130E|nr:pleckstrin homology domain-containing family G member 3 isoform X2 [Rhinatrema bivittatum]
MSEGSKAPVLEGLNMPEISVSLETARRAEDPLALEEPLLTSSNTHGLEEQPYIYKEYRSTASKAPELKEGAHTLIDTLSVGSLVPCEKESQRLSTVSSSSSNERMSSSASLSTDISDSERPVSLVSNASSGSLRDSHYVYESNGVEAGMSQPPDGFRNRRLDLHLELLPSTEEALQMDYKDAETARSPKSNQTHNNNMGSCRGLRGSRSLSPFSSKVTRNTHNLTYVERVVLELVETERMYVRDLRSIVEDYLGKIIDTAQELPMRPEQVSALFGNIEDIYELNSELLQDLDSCHNDPVTVASCFVEKSQDFDIYTQYCTNYPNSVAALTECMRNKLLATFFRERQEELKHSLPLGSYLLKPVQRILKYHLLLQEIAKHFDVEEDGYEVVEEAIDTMTGVAWYINDMKRKHEHAIRLQEIQSLLLNWKGMDLTTYGELILEGTFRVQRARNERTLFLFDKALFITKKRGDHFTYKTHILCSSLMLIESSKDSLCFSVTHYKNSKQQHSVQARTVEEKRLWTHHIKKLILENHHAIIPQKAKEAILEMDALYSSRYKYSPERIKKAMSTDEQMVPVRQGRRQSEPSKNILKQLGEKVRLKHSGSAGALLDTGDFLQPGTDTLVSSLGQPKTRWEDVEEEVPYKEDSLEHLNLSDSKRKGTEAEHTASEEEEEEEILMGEDQSKETREQEMPKGFKRQNSQSSGNAEKRRSVEVPSAPEPADAETQLVPVQEDQHPGEIHSDLGSVNLPKPVLGAQTGESESDQYLDVHDPVDHTESENLEDLKPLSSEDEEDEAAIHETGGILPPSVLDQASIIAERFINNLSRRNSLALDDGKLIGCLTPRLSSRSASILSLECLEKPQHHNSSCELQTCQPSEEVSSDPVNIVTECISPLKGALSPSLENTVEGDRGSFKKKESMLSTQDRLLLDKIKSYYDYAEHHDASFSIKRRESLSYIPVGVVRNSVFKFNSLPRPESIRDFPGRNRIDSTSSNSSSTGPSRPASWASLDVPASVRHGASKPSSICQQLSDHLSRNAAPEDDFPVKETEFKSPSEMIGVWEEIEKAGSETWTKDYGVLMSADKESSKMTLVHRENKNNTSRNDHVNKASDDGFDLHEPLLILEDSDLSTITEESLAPSPQSNSPCQAEPAKLTCGAINPDQDLSSFEGDLPLKLHPKIMQLANSMDGAMTEKVKNKVYQMARQYSQRIKCNKPMIQRRLRELEEDLRGNGLSSLQEEKQDPTAKSNLNLALSLPSYDHVSIQEHGPLTPASSCSPREKSPKRFTFSPSSTSPGISSPSRSGCRSPHSPEKFHWPDVRELRSKYASKASASQEKALPVNRSQSVPERIAEEPLEGQTKAKLGHSCSMNVKQTGNLADQRNKQGEQYYSSKSQQDTETFEGTSVNARLNGGILESPPNHRNQSYETGGTYYISAEAPLENCKRVIVVEKLSPVEDELDGPDREILALENEDNYLERSSPPSRETISFKAVIEQCKTYQESEEYCQQEEDEQEPKTCPEPERVPQQVLLEMTDQKKQGRVKNLREKFQILSSNS